MKNLFILISISLFLACSKSDNTTPAIPRLILTGGQWHESNSLNIFVFSTDSTYFTHGTIPQTVGKYIYSGNRITWITSAGYGIDSVIIINPNQFKTYDISFNIGFTSVYTRQ